MQPSDTGAERVLPLACLAECAKGGEPMARILIAEDDPRAREVIARICQFKGHEVRETRDAMEALGELERFAPDLLITDLAMPLGGGQHLVRELRATPAGIDLPVIVITGYAALLSEHEKATFRPCTILSKPLELQALLTALEEALEGAQAPEV